MSEPQVPASSPTAQTAGRRKRSNPWLAHVKDTMRKNRGVSFKNVLKIAKKSFKKAKKSRSKSQTQTQNQTQNQNQNQAQNQNQTQKTKQAKQTKTLVKLKY